MRHRRADLAWPGAPLRRNALPAAPGAGAAAAGACPADPRPCPRPWPRPAAPAGGNAGFSTSLFKLLWPEATVVTLEPDPSNFAALKRNTQGCAAGSA